MDAQSLSRLLGQLEKVKKRPKRKQCQTSSDDDDDYNKKDLHHFFLGKSPKKDKRTARKKRQHEIRQLMKQAKVLISAFPATLSECDDPPNVIGGGKKIKKGNDGSAVIGSTQAKKNSRKST